MSFKSLPTKKSALQVEGSFRGVIEEGLKRGDGGNEAATLETK